MKTSRTSMPEVNTGSMADIAFLLLIFFLITTTVSSDAGINRKLPKDCPLGIDCGEIDIHERNILRITINDKDEILVEDSLISIKDIKQLTKAFVDNNGDSSCDYCLGNKLIDASDNPYKAVVSLQTGRLTTYKQFIAVQDEITKAYHELRSSYSNTILNKTQDELTNDDIKKIRKAYPLILSEAVVK